MRKLVTTVVIAAGLLALTPAVAAPASAASTICSGTGSSWYYCRAYPFRPTAWDLAGWR